MEHWLRHWSENEKLDDRHWHRKRRRSRSRKKSRRMKARKKDPHTYTSNSMSIHSFISKLFFVNGWFEKFSSSFNLCCDDFSVLGFCYRTVPDTSTQTHNSIPYSYAFTSISKHLISMNVAFVCASAVVIVVVWIANNYLFNHYVLNYS